MAMTAVSTLSEGFPALSINEQCQSHPPRHVTAKGFSSVMETTTTHPTLHTEGNHTAFAATATTVFLLFYHFNMSLTLSASLVKRTRSKWSLPPREVV